MGQITGKSKHIALVRRELQASGGIEIVGSVPDSQVYQPDTGEYTPDYTLAPLVLFPRCNATDPDSLDTGECVNASLTNMNWYEIKNGTRTLIQPTNTGYAITQEGDTKGQIQVKKNIALGEPITLEFYAEYVPTDRTGVSMVFRFTKPLKCKGGTAGIPVIMMDSPAGVDWNPLRDTDEQTITARMLVGETDVTASGKAKFFFYRVVEDTGALEKILGAADSEAAGDNDWEVTALTANTLSIDRNLIDEGVTYVVKASYDPDGSPADEPDDAIGMLSTSIRRRIPALEADFEGVPTEVPKGTYTLHPKAVVRDTKGVLDNPWGVLRADWYTKASGSSTWTLAAKGEPEPDIAMADGMQLELRVMDRGPYALVVSGDSILTYNGQAVIARKES